MVDLAAAASDISPSSVTVTAPVINKMAEQMRQLPANLHPLYNPSVYRNLPDHAKAAVSAAAAQVFGNAPPATRSVTMDLADLEGIGSYETGPVDPESGLLRLPEARLEVVGSALLTLSNVTTSGTLKWSPQRDFKAVRFIFPSGLAAGCSIGNILVGNHPIYLGGGSEPAENFSEASTSAEVDFPICRVGITIAAALFNATLGGATNFYTALLGYVTDRKEAEPLRGLLRRMPIPEQTIAGGASYTYALNPQDAFKVRKIAIDQTVAASFIITSLSIGNEPQLLSGDPIPAQAFADRAIATWVDFDRCKTGQQIFMTVTNTTGAPVNFRGVFLGDIDADAR